MQQITKEEIYTVLFQRILDGKYGESTRLKELDLAKEFGISRTPIREVLQLLAQDGVIGIVPNKGAVVKPLVPDDIEEIYEIRKSLELLALEYAVPLINLNELNKIREQIVAAAESKNLEMAIKSDRALHNFIIESSKKTRLINMTNQLLRIIKRFRFIGFHDPAISKRVFNEHQELIEALVFRDVELAKQVLTRHLDNSKKATLQIIFVK